MFELSLSVEGKKKESVKLRLYDKRKIPNLIRGIDKATLQLERVIKSRKLSGQVLNVRTGRLRSSFAMQRARYQSGIGVYGLVGTNVIYARIHEVGGVIKPTAGKYLRFKTPDGSWHTVKQVTIPARPYAAPAMREEKGYIGRVIIREVMRPLKK